MFVDYYRMYHLQLLFLVVVVAAAGAVSGPGTDADAVGSCSLYDCPPSLLLL